MPARPPRPCTTPGCTSMAPDGRCETCRRRRQRPSASERGYDAAWRRERLAYLLANPRCALCNRLAEVADHHPVSRRTLVNAGCEDPDAPHRLRPLCDPCHRAETARLQPGGWHRRTQN